jgi:putative membrane protein insertion efficiency factor
MTSSAISKVLARALILPIRAYQAVHVAFFRGSCRFHPTCSHYAVEALEVHGPLRGSWLALLRILRCQPFCRGGFDPVPHLESRDGAREPRAERPTPLTLHGSAATSAAPRP